MVDLTAACLLAAVVLGAAVDLGAVSSVAGLVALAFSPSAITFSRIVCRVPSVSIRTSCVMSFLYAEIHFLFFILFFDYYLFICLFVCLFVCLFICVYVYRSKQTRFKKNAI